MSGLASQEPLQSRATRCHDLSIYASPVSISRLGAFPAVGEGDRGCRGGLHSSTVSLRIGCCIGDEGQTRCVDHQTTSVGISRVFLWRPKVLHSWNQVFHG
ncbi:unnamed protein product [Victoria cruziana]